VVDQAAGVATMDVVAGSSAMEVIVIQMVHRPPGWGNWPITSARSAGSLATRAVNAGRSASRRRHI
jgi:hypothetical protein